MDFGGFYCICIVVGGHQILPKTLTVTKIFQFSQVVKLKGIS